MKSAAKRGILIVLALAAFYILTVEVFYRVRVFLHRGELDA